MQNLLLCGALFTTPALADFRTEEMTWQALHVVDTLQSYQGAKDPGCYQESEERWALGRHPKPKDVILFNIAFGVLHAGISYALDRAGWDRTRKVWEVITILDTTRAVVNNTRIYLTPWGSNCGANYDNTRYLGS